MADKHTPQGEATATALTLAPDRRAPRGAVQALQRGDLDGVLAAYAVAAGLEATALVGPVAADATANPLRHLVRHIAADMLELRRENVALLGDAEAFVRKFPNGELKQVIRPVALSTADGTLYRIPVSKKQGDEWVDVTDETRANVTAQGFHRLNAVAGCHIGFPATVSVEGVERANPYVERSMDADGAPGDVRRVVVKVIVIGPSPATGNPVGVTYLLDYDPRVDLRLALMKLASPKKWDRSKIARDKRPVQVIPTSQWAAFLESHGEGAAFRWAFQGLHAGLGLAYDLWSEDVLEVQQDYLKGTQHLTKKAQTVATRNAMRAHPALAYNIVATPDRVTARIGIVGWTVSGQMDRYMANLDRLTRGLPLPEGELEAHTVIEAAYDADMSEDAAAEQRAEAGDDPNAERAYYVARIDEALTVSPLTLTEIRALNYNPTANTIEELKRILSALNTPTT